MDKVGDEDTTTPSMKSFWCLCCLLWTCFALPSAVSVFDFGHVGVCGALIVVNTSSSIYKVIRPVLNFLFFFYNKILQALKAQSIY